MKSQFPRVAVPKMIPRAGRPAPPETARVLGGPSRLVYGAPHTPLRWAAGHVPLEVPWNSEDQTIAARAPRPVWSTTDMLPSSPGYEGAPFGPGLEGPAEDFEALRAQAERLSGRPIPTEAELRARLGPSFDLSRYQESVRRLVALYGGYTLRMPDGSVVSTPTPPQTYGPPLLDNPAGDALKKLSGVAVAAAVVAGVVLLLPMIRRGR